MIRIKHLYKTYPSPENKGRVAVLCDLSLTVETGEFVAIMGESGAGKSTLMNIIGAIDTPNSGSYLLSGVEMTGLSPGELTAFRAGQIGFIFQNSSLIPSLTALENAALPLYYRRVGKKERIKRAKEALSLVGLSERMGHLPHQLSGGQRQRAAIARVIASDPPMILADEPTGSLDAASGREVMGALKRLNEAGKTVLLITHDPHCAAYAKRVLYLKDGKLYENK